MKHHSTILTKYFLLLFILITCIHVFTEIWQNLIPTEQQVRLYSEVKIVKVLSEKMDLTVVSSDKYDDYFEFYRVKYKVSYQIYSEKEAKLPLLFIAQNMAS